MHSVTSVVLYVSDLAGDGCEPHGKVITADAVMKKLAEMGYGKMQTKDWQHLVDFRLFLPPASATMLLDCLFQVCNGRVCTSPKTYSEIHSLHQKAHAWPKIFLLVETYCSELLSEEAGGHRAVSHKGPHAKTVKTLDTKAIKQLAEQKDLLDKVTKFFAKVVMHYSIDVEHEGASEEKKMLANATLMKALLAAHYGRSRMLYSFIRGPVQHLAVWGLWLDMTRARTIWFRRS